MECIPQNTNQVSPANAHQPHSHQLAISDPSVSLPLMDYHQHHGHHHHPQQVNTEVSFPAYPAEANPLYYHHHQSDPVGLLDYHHHHQAQHEQAHHDYTSQQAYCTPPVQQHEYPFYNAAGGASDAQSSSGYFSSPATTTLDHYSGTTELMAGITPYDCYNSSSQDHLEVKYQAVFVEALEGATTNNGEQHLMDPLAVQQSQQQQQPQAFETYETNYGNNQWTSMATTTSSYAYTADQSFVSSTASIGLQNETDLPNYCFAACVFSSGADGDSNTPPTSTEPTDIILQTGGQMNGSAGFSPPARHFDSYDYPSALMLSEELQPAL